MKKVLFSLDFITDLWYIGRVMTTKIKENTMKKIYEYITITMSVIGLMAMIGDTMVYKNQWLLGGSMALLGIASFILALYSQEKYKEVK